MGYQPANSQHQPTLSQPIGSKTSMFIFTPWAESSHGKSPEWFAKNLHGKLWKLLENVETISCRMPKEIGTGQ